MPTPARKPKRDNNRNSGSSLANRGRRQQRIAAIRNRFVKSSINLKKPPTEMKSRIQGKVSNSVQIETGSFQAVLWNDAGGKKMLIKRNSNSTFREVRDSDASIAEHVESVLFSGQKGIQDGIPSTLVIELGGNDSQQDVLKELNDIDPALADRVEFVGGLPATTYSSWRKDLEEGSGDRLNNAAYLQILGILDKAIQAENKTPVTLESVQDQINLLEQLKREIPLAKSTKRKGKDKRNAALAQLESKISAQQQQLSRDKVQLLKAREQGIRDLGVAKRTPSEVLVHFLDSIRKAQQAEPNSAVLKKLEKQVKETILKHKMTLSRTQKILNNANATLKANNQPELAKLTETLQSHLPATEDALSPTRLHDNIYGRVLDSAIVTGLVDNPPEGVKVSMQQAAKAMAGYLREASVSDAFRNEIAEGMQENLNSKDPRFWLPLVPSLKALAEADSPEAATKALLAFLDNPGDDGAAMVAIPYMLVKTANILQRKKTPWMEKAGKNYWGVITKQTGRTDRPALLDPADPDNRITQVSQADSEGAGITLRHQPNPFVADGMVPSLRPTLKNMPAFDQDLNFPSESAETALTHGLPFASGVSGSTNIMLHLLDNMRSQGDDVDVKNFLLGTMMFLVYDGGHSIQEVLWTANQLDKQLNLGLNLGDPDKANEFVADYERFVALYKDDSTGPVLRDAVDSAVDTTLNYFAERSVYSDKQTEATEPSNDTKTSNDKPRPARPSQRAVKAVDSLTLANTPPPAAPEMGDLSHPNPALYFKANDQGGENLRVDSVNPGEGWVRIEQFCSLLATHWLINTPGENLSFASLSAEDQVSAMNTLASQSGKGLAAQLQHAQTQLQGTPENKDEVTNKLNNQGYPAGTKIWFANDKHAQAALVLPNNRYQVYNPDNGTPAELSQAEFRSYIQNNNAFLVKQPLPVREVLPPGGLNVVRTPSPVATIPLAVPSDSTEKALDESSPFIPPLPADATVKTPPEPPAPTLSVPPLTADTTIKAPPEPLAPTLSAPPLPADTTIKAPPDPPAPNPNSIYAAFPTRKVDTRIMSVDAFKKATSSGLSLGRTAEYNNTLTALENYHAEIDNTRQQAVVMKDRIVAASKNKNALLKEKFAKGNEKSRLQSGIENSKEALTKTSLELRKLNLDNESDQAKITSLQKRMDSIKASIKSDKARLDKLETEINKIDRDIKIEDVTVITPLLIANNNLFKLQQQRLNARAKALSKATDTYRLKKQSSSKQQKKDTLDTVLDQVADPLQDLQRIKEAYTKAIGIEHDHQLSSPMEVLSSGTASEVYKVELNATIGNTGTNVGFAKKAPEVENDTTRNLGFGLQGKNSYSEIDNPEQHPNLIARQVVSYRVAEQLGVSVLSPELFSTGHDGSVLGVSGVAKGAEMMKRTEKADVYTHVDLSNPTTQRGLADLQIMDAINGQMDRHMGNVFVDPATGTVTGIDNDMAHPKDAVVDRFATNQLSGQFTGDGVNTKLVYNQTLIAKDTAERIIAMDRETLRVTLQGNPNDPEHLDSQAIENTLLRFDAVKAQCQKLQQEGKLIEADGWNEDTLDQAISDGFVAGGDDSTQHTNYVARAAYKYAEAGNPDNPNVQLPSGFDKPPLFDIEGKPPVPPPPATF